MLLHQDLYPLEDISPLVKPRISKRAKRLALRLDHKEGLIYLIIPYKTKMHKAIEFARQHQNWINDRIAELPEPVKFNDGTILPICGQDVILDIYYSKTLRKTDIALKRNILSIKTNKDDPSPRLVRFLKEMAKQELTNLAYQKAALSNKKLKSLQVRDTKSRWGSCSHDGKISLSWRLIFSPFEAMDYVVAHEIAHLTHMDHSSKFWALCTDLSTDYSTGKTWMRKHGHSLMRFG